MNRNIKLFYKNALGLKMPVSYRPELKNLEICFGKNYFYFSISRTPLNHGAQVMASKNKYVANKLLHASGFPVPKSLTFTKNAYLQKPLENHLKDLKFPLVAKPLIDSGRGAGVLCNIKDIAALSNYLDGFFSQFKAVQIEEFHQSLKEYRVMVLNNSVIGVVERIPPHVIGDGIHSIEELMALKNVHRKILAENVTISPMQYDIEYANCLQEQGLSLTDIPENGKKIRLCYTVNTGRGGEVFSHGKQLHAENAKKICAATHALGLEYAGVDLLCEDIHQPFVDGKWTIIEINFCPDTTIHEIAPQGKKTPVIKKLLRQIIWKHPFMYLWHIISRSSLSIYFRLALILIPLLVLSHFLYKI